MTSKDKSDHFLREASQSMDGDVTRMQMDFMFVGAEGTFVDESRAKATVLMMICKDDVNLSATEVRAKTDEYDVEIMIRFLSAYDSVEIKTDGESSTVEITRRIQARRDKTTTLTKTSVGGPQEIGAGTCEWNSADAVASVFPGRARTYESENHSRYLVVSMDVTTFCLDDDTLPVRSKNETDSA